MEVGKELLSKHKIILVVASGDYYNDLLNTVKQLSDSSICYITLNKTRDALIEDFKNNNIDMTNMIVIDAISKTMKTDQKAEEKCFFVSSPGALTELSIAIKKFLDYGFEYMIFDSLNSLLIYRKVPIVKRWISSIMENIKASKSRAIFYTLNLKEQEELIKEAGLFADETLHLGKEGAVVSAFTGRLSGEEKINKEINSGTTELAPKKEVNNEKDEK